MERRNRRTFTKKFKLQMVQLYLNGKPAKEITQYIYWYNHDRIKSRLGGISPIQFKEKYFETKI